MSDATDELIAPATLSRHDAAIDALTQDHVATAALADDESRCAFRYYVVFADPERAAKLGLQGITPLRAFYNVYYRFKRFVALNANVNGFDAGLEQPAFASLEHAPAEVDWALVEALDARASSVAVSSGCR